jgi:tRNA U34 5-methylaminomethyl-2-thiouridine-forming methyltransferase MnmC
MYRKKLIITEDGSHSIELVGQEEQYHSVHGAIQESQHVYIDYGLHQIAKDKDSISVLEIGMGTGLNVLLTYLYSQKNDINIKYHTLEPYPLEEDIWEQLNYTRQLSCSDCQEVFDKIHSSKWNDHYQLSDSFEFFKEDTGIIERELQGKYDVIYFDAFNPDLEPNLWTEEVFRKIYESMNQNSLLTTYSTKGIVKRALKSCGFKIDKKPGPTGKREILNAWKS